MRPGRLLQHFAVVACCFTSTAFASAEAQESAATHRTGVFSAALGHGWGNSDDLDRFGWDLLARVGYTAANGFYTGATFEWYHPDSVEYELESEEAYTMAGGAELGYDHRLSENWVFRVALVNGVASFVTTRCDIERSELGSAYDEKSCHPKSNEWRYLLGLSAEAHYVWRRGLVYAAVRPTSFLGALPAAYGVTVVVGFGAVFRPHDKRR